MMDALRTGMMMMVLIWRETKARKEMMERAVLVFIFLLSFAC